jgi:hypothetical protein
MLLKGLSPATVPLRKDGLLQIYEERNGGPKKGGGMGLLE